LVKKVNDAFRAEYDQKNDQSQNVLNRQTALFRLSADLATIIDEDDIWNCVVEGLHETIGYDFVAIFMLDKSSNIRILKASAGFVDPITPLKPGEGLSEQVFFSGKLQYTPDITKDPRFSYGAGGSEVDVPVSIGKEVEGVLIAESKNKENFTQHDFDVLTAAAHITGIAIERARLFELAHNEIKERKRIQKEILHQKEYYEALLINNPAAVVAANLSNKIISWNPAAEQLFGYEEIEVVGKNLDLYVANHESIKDEAEQYTDDVLNLNRIQKVTKRTRKDGSLIDVELLALPIIVGEKLEGFVAIYHDLSEVKAIERELREKNLKMERELALAGEIQASFLPKEIPTLPGWQISTELLPARETSGDFFNIRILNNSQVVFFIADVLDKGVGAALFMTLCWTLLQIFLNEYPSEPKRVFWEINNRILRDTTSTQFLTIFYGVLDPITGKVVYSNAGHCPPYLLKNQRNHLPQPLIRTGMPLAVQYNENWDQDMIELDEGDVLFLYTDGVTEGQNDDSVLYGVQRLKTVLKDHRGNSAEEIKDSVIHDLESFVGGKIQSDDIAILVIKKGD